MREQKYGRIVNFSSVVTKIPTLGVSAYAASKAGLVGMTKTIAAENAAYGITANSINLGYVDLGMGINSVPEKYQELIKQRNPMRRFCHPEEIYNAISFLIKTEYINGANIDIDGGV
jgi:NAD(P)-dependent dehydrogenase (short-subunit alcohol dehydrogenase family)